jgi:hypothetical protein
MKRALGVVLRTRPAINQSINQSQEQQQKTHKKEVVRSSYLQQKSRRFNGY